MASTLTDRLNGVNGGVAQKAPVKCATTANITLSGEQTIDGVDTSSTDVLVMMQDDATENGIWTSSTGSWSRRPDADGNRDLVRGSEVYVTDGTVYGNSLWSLRADTDSVVIGTTEITFENFASVISSDFLTVLLTAAASGDYIRYNGTNWVNYNLLAADSAFTGNNSFAGSQTLTGKVITPTKSTLTIASGSITPTGAVHTVANEGAATSDNLSTITAGTDGQTLTISASHATNTTIIDETGNIQIDDATTIILVGQSKTVSFIYRATISKWVVTSQTQVTKTGSLQTAAGTETYIDFLSIPEGVRRIYISIAAFSTNGTDRHVIQIGDSGGVETSGYLGDTQSVGVTGSVWSEGFVTIQNPAAAGNYGGLVILTLMDAATNLWTSNINCARTDSAEAYYGGGYKALSGTLDRIRITTSGGTNTIDSGSKINIQYDM